MSEFIPYWERKGRKLSPLMKKAWIMKKRNYKHQEIADILGVTRMAVDKSIYRARKIINKYPDCIDYKELNEIFLTIKK